MQLFRMESVKVPRPASQPVYCRTSTNTTSTCVLAGVGSLCVPPLSVSVNLCLRHFFPYFFSIFLFHWYTCIPTGPCGNSPLGSKQHCKRHQCDSCDHGSASNVSTCEVRSARSLSLCSSTTLYLLHSHSRGEVRWYTPAYPRCFRCARMPHAPEHLLLPSNQESTRLEGCTAEVFKTLSNWNEVVEKKKKSLPKTVPLISSPN